MHKFNRICGEDLIGSRLWRMASGCVKRSFSDDIN